MIASFHILRYPSGSGSCARRNSLHGLAELKGAGLAAQKKSIYAAERVKQLRRDFLEALPGQDVARFKFVDKTLVNLICTRRYGRPKSDHSSGWQPARGGGSNR